MGFGEDGGMLVIQIGLPYIVDVTDRNTGQSFIPVLSEQDVFPFQDLPGSRSGQDIVGFIGLSQQDDVGPGIGTAIAMTPVGLSLKFGSLETTGNEPLRLPFGIAG